MTNRRVFFSRCRPQECDAIELALREKRVFIGWPAWRSGVKPERGHLREAIYDLWCSNEEWNAAYDSLGAERRHYEKNRNFVRAIDEDDIALIPRPDQGLVFAGRVIRKFELLDDPPWAEHYLHIRQQQGCDVSDEFSHIADVAHCCEVDHFRPLSFPIIPAWIRRSLLGRSTYGRIKPLPELQLDPFPILDRLIDHPDRAELPWTVDVSEVERRLVDGIGPNSFEHLCVALLQLEQPRQLWAQVGGSGDGGVDGIGSDERGKVVGLLQCKWVYQGEPIFSGAGSQSSTAHHVLASLIHDHTVTPGSGIEFWGRSKVAQLMLKHAHKLPSALTLRIGNGLG